MQSLLLATFTTRFDPFGREIRPPGPAGAVVSVDCGSQLRRNRIGQPQSRVNPIKRRTDAAAQPRLKKNRPPPKSGPESHSPANGPQPNGHAPTASGRLRQRQCEARRESTTAQGRATAESMAAGQRDISVSEFFAKNRHLLGFDNPRKALLTTIKEAVDNAPMPAKKPASCPRSGSISKPPAQSLQSGHSRQRAGHRQAQIPEYFRQAAVWLEVSSPSDEPRPARHWH